MIAGVKDEIMRLDYTIEQCEANEKEHPEGGLRRHKLDIPFMKACRDALIVYRDLHLR